MADLDTEYQQITAQMATLPGVARGVMFGMPCVKINGKAFVGYFEGAMIFKLTGQAHADALALPGAALFDPSGRGRPMKEWVRVPYAQAAAWTGLADAALGYVASLARSETGPSGERLAAKN